MIPTDIEGEILRLYHVEKWRPGTIANQLRLHHSVVRRVLERDGVPRTKLSRPAEIDRFRPFIESTLREYPKLTAARLYDMVRERGYQGKMSQFRHWISKLRPSEAPEAFFRLRSSPGDESQVDWGHFGKIQIGRAERPLVAFVMVLSYSRAIFLRFFVGQGMSFFLTGHEEAFARWKGVSRNLLYDNLKSVVTHRTHGDAIQFNDTFLAFANHYRFRPRPVGVRRGCEKGRVERAIRYIRSSFFAARRFKGLDDLNEQADHWCQRTAMQRRWPDDDRRTVADAFLEEQPALLALRETKFPCHELKEIKVGKTPYARFDLNDYSVPHNYTRRRVTVVADTKVVRILNATEVIAIHSRSFDRHAQIVDEKHFEDLKDSKRRAAKGHCIGTLHGSVPSSGEFLKRVALRGSALGHVTRQLQELHRTYGSTALEAAIKEALAKNATHPQAVRHILERDRLDVGEAAALPLALPNDPRIRNLSVTPHPLHPYDNLKERSTDDDDNDNPK